MTTPAPFIDDLDLRMDALRAAIKEAMPSRVHKESYIRDMDSHEIEELHQGVIMLTAGAETDYSDQQGMEAKEGTLSVGLVAHLMVRNDADGKTVEAEEIAIIKEIKQFVRTGVPGIGLELASAVLSGQQATPYGFVVAQINAGPPADNVY